MKKKKKKSLSEVRADAGRAGGAASTPAKRRTARANGEQGGRPRNGNPAIKRIMRDRGVSRQRAWVIFRSKQK